jgi:hypothetical protein
VISFWAEIASRPFLKFVLFNGVTAALFGVGLYTDRKWKIPTTSHALLVIATLLVPLNFLAIAAFTQDAPPAWMSLTVAGEGASLLVFAVLVYLAARIITPEAAVPMAVGVMLPSLVQLLIRRWAGPASPIAEQYALAGVPLGCYVAAVLWPVRRHWANGAEAGLNETAAQRFFILLGIASAAAFSPLGLLVSKMPPVPDALHRLSPLVVLCGVPAVVVGLLFWARMKDRRFTGTQTAGIAVGVLGALAMGGAAALAWPDPATLLPVAVMNVATLSGIAFGFGIPSALLPAGVALVAGWLVGYHWQQGNVSWMLPSYEPMTSALFSVASGHALAPLVGLLGLFAALLGRWNRKADATMVAAVAGGTLVASLGLLLWFGFGRFGDPNGATWTMAAYAVATLAAAAVTDIGAVAGAGWALLLVALIQGVVFRWGETLGLERPWATALLLHASLAAVAWAAIVYLSRRLPRMLRATHICAAASAAAATALVTAAILVTSARTSALLLAWAAAVWLAVSLLSKNRVAFVVSQIAVVIAIFWGVVAGVEGREWYAAGARPWLDPWFLEAQGVAMAGYCLICGALRMVARWRAKPQAVEGAFWDVRPGVDHVLEAALVVLLVLVSCCAAWPGVAQELSPLERARGAATATRVVAPIEAFELAGVPHSHAADRGAWLLVTAVAGMLVLGLWQRTAVENRLGGLLLTLWAICPLVAARWEADVAVASALRWAVAAFFLVASIPIWLRWGGSQDTSGGRDVYRRLRDVALALVALTYAVLAGCVAQAAIRQAGFATGSDDLWPTVLAWALLTLCAALGLGKVSNSGLGEKLTRGAIYSWATSARSVILFLGIAPVVILLAFAVAAALDQHPLVGPEPMSWFRRIGHDVSYGVPLAVIALVLVGHAARDRSSEFAFAAGLLGNVVATLVVLVRLVRAGRPLDEASWIAVGQVNAMVAGVVALMWMGAVAWDRRRKGAKSQVEEPPGRAADDVENRFKDWPGLLLAEVVLSGVLLAVFLVPGALRVALEPAPVGWAVVADGALGWTAAALAVAATVWMSAGAISAAGVSLVSAAVVMLAAVTAARWDIGNWLAYYTLLGGFAVCQWLVPPVAHALKAIGKPDRASPLVWSSAGARFFGVMTVVLGLRALETNPLAPWATIAALSITSARNVLIAWREGGRTSMWIAAHLLNLAASIWWIRSGYRLTGTGDFGQVFELIWLNALVAAAMALVSVFVSKGRLGFHRFAAWAIVGALLLTTSLGLAADLEGRPIAANTALCWLAWIGALVTAAVCWWDKATRWPVGCLYSVGLVGVGIYLDGLNFTAPMFHWALANALAAYSLVAAYIWSRREDIHAQLAKWRVPLAVATEAGSQAAAGSWPDRGGHAWLVSAGLLSAIVVTYLVAWVEVDMPKFSMRMIAAYAVGAEALSLAFLAQGAVRSPLQYMSLVFGALFAVAFACAWVPPEFGAPWLHRAVAAATALAAATVVYGIGLVKLLRRENEWTLAAQRLVPLLIAVAAVLVVVVLGNEVAAFAADRPAPMQLPAIAAVLAALVGMAAAALVTALVPGRDPLGLSERGRTAYVYAAEALVGLAFLHVRVTMPWLFAGLFLRFWPLVVMGLAFLGVGLSEVFQRRKQNVLSEPLMTTGAILPLLPALGFWITSSEVHYSLLLLSAGSLYAVMSVLRKSFVYSVLAAIAANGSLWYLLYQREGLGIAEHPQLWLIPPALCVLAAAYLNRSRLSAEQFAALRYAMAIVIYASSTADIFINGVADAPWLPAVLAGLSIAGVFAGILLRVRAFLYLGTAFLLVAIASVIWYAAIEQQRTWVLWIAGIVTGVLILALFGMFEKRREDVLGVIDRMKQWEG